MCILQYCVRSYDYRKHQNYDKINAEVAKNTSFSKYIQF